MVINPIVPNFLVFSVDLAHFLYVLSDVDEIDVLFLLLGPYIELEDKIARLLHPLQTPETASSPCKGC